MTRDDLLEAIAHGEPLRRQDLSALDLANVDLSGAIFEEVRFPIRCSGVNLKESAL